MDMEDDFKEENMRDWDEVIPGIDPETKEMYEQWDEIYHGTNHEPVMLLFDPPLVLPPPDSLSEEQAAIEVRMIVSRLTEFCIAIDKCEHATELWTYRWLLDEVLPEAEFTPASLGSGIIQHFSTYESCPQCEAEFEAEWESREQQGKDIYKDFGIDDLFE